MLRLIALSVEWRCEGSIIQVVVISLQRFALAWTVCKSQFYQGTLTALLRMFSAKLQIIKAIGQLASALGLIEEGL